MQEKYLSVQEFAALAGVSHATVYNLIKRQTLKHKEVRLGGRMVSVVPDSELSKFKINP